MDYKDISLLLFSQLPYKLRILKCFFFFNLSFYFFPAKPWLLTENTCPIHTQSTGEKPGFE